MTGSAGFLETTRFHKNLGPQDVGFDRTRIEFVRPIYGLQSFFKMLWPVERFGKEQPRARFSRALFGKFTHERTGFLLAIEFSGPTTQSAPGPTGAGFDCSGMLDAFDGLVSFAVPP